MLLTIGQKKIQDEIFRKNVGFGNFSEIHGIHVLPAPEVQAYAEDIKYKVANEIDFTEKFEKLREFRIFILSLDGYGFSGDFQKIQREREGFSDMEVEELLELFADSEKKDWESDREYYFALFEMIEDKLEEKGISLGFDGLFEFGI